MIIILIIIYAYLYVHIRIYIYICIYTYICVYIYVHMTREMPLKRFNTSSRGKTAMRESRFRAVSHAASAQRSRERVEASASLSRSSRGARAGSRPLTERDRGCGVESNLRVSMLRAGLRAGLLDDSLTKLGALPTTMLLVVASSFCYMLRPLACIIVSPLDFFNVFGTFSIY